MFYFLLFLISMDCFGSRALLRLIIKSSLFTGSASIYSPCTWTKTEINLCQVFFFFSLTHATVSFFCSNSILFHPVFSKVEIMSLRSFILIFNGWWKRPLAAAQLAGLESIGNVLSDYSPGSGTIIHFCYHCQQEQWVHGWNGIEFFAHYFLDRFFNSRCHVKFFEWLLLNWFTSEHLNDDWSDSCHCGFVVIFGLWFYYYFRSTLSLYHSLSYLSYMSTLVHFGLCHGQKRQH